MAKKRPTAANVRQGQTVYLVSLDPDMRSGYYVDKIFLDSQRAPLPAEGESSGHWPVSHIREFLAYYCCPQFVFFSRRKAQSLARRFNAAFFRGQAERRKRMQEQPLQAGD